MNILIICAVSVVATRAARRDLTLRDVIDIIQRSRADHFESNENVVDDVLKYDLSRYPRTDTRGDYLPDSLYLHSDLGLSYNAEDRHERIYVPVSKKKKKSVLIVLKSPPYEYNDGFMNINPINYNPLPVYHKAVKRDIDASEVFDDWDSEKYNLRRSSRRRRKKKDNKRDDDIFDSSSESSSSSSSSSDEKNPGNPFTVHKDKYKQNWLWDFVMSGDHMNINPNAPKFPALGPSGPQLFFGRKWWYYNQDDYKPMGGGRRTLTRNDIL